MHGSLDGCNEEETEERLNGSMYRRKKERKTKTDGPIDDIAERRRNERYPEWLDGRKAE